MSPIVQDVDDIVPSSLAGLDLEDRNGDRIPFHAPPTRGVERAPGLWGMTGARSVLRPRPGGHGGLNDSQFLGEHALTIEGWVWGETSSEAAIELEALKAALYDSLATERALRYHRGIDGLPVQRWVRLADGGLAVTVAALGKGLRYQAQLLCSDPRAYTQTLLTEEGGTLSVAAGGKLYADDEYDYPRSYNASAGGQATVNNLGNVETPAVLRIHGPITAPRVRLLTTGEEIRLVGEIANGDYIELDVRARTVKLNGETSRLGLLDFGNSTWWEIPPGEHIVQLLSTTFDPPAHVDVLYRPAYL